MLSEQALLMALLQFRNLLMEPSWVRQQHSVSIMVRAILLKLTSILEDEASHFDPVSHQTLPLY